MINVKPHTPIKLMILGGNGQVGQQLQQQGRQRQLLGLFPMEIIPVARKTTAVTLDLKHPKKIVDLLNWYQPDIVINAAAYTAVDQAESELELAMKINAIAPKILATELEKTNGLLIHYSTNYVFDGQQTTPYIETDLAHPINRYGQSKLAGEQAIQAVTPNHLIFRTSWVYDCRSKNFLLTMLKLLQTRPQVRVVSDQFGSPTSARLIAAVTYRILESLLTAPKSPAGLGLYHLTTQGVTSWYGFATRIRSYLAQIHRGPIAELIPVPTGRYPTSAPRPPFAGLNCQKLMQMFDLTLPAWELELATVLKAFNADPGSR